MKNKELKLIGLSLFVVLVVITVVSFFIKNDSFLSMVNYLSIPILVLTILVMINKLFSNISNRLQVMIDGYSKTLDGYLELTGKYIDNKEIIPDYDDKMNNLINDTKKISKNLAGLISMRDKYTKISNICFWLIGLPIICMLLLSVFYSFLNLPIFNLPQLNYLSLLLLLVDWLIMDFIENKIVNKSYDLVTKETENQFKDKTNEI